MVKNLEFYFKKIKMKHVIFALATFAILFSMVVLVIYFSLTGGKLSSAPKDYSYFGSLIGGLFSIVSSSLLIITLLVQMESIKESKIRNEQSELIQQFNSSTSSIEALMLMKVSSFEVKNFLRSETRIYDNKRFKDFFIENFGYETCEYLLKNINHSAFELDVDTILRMIVSDKDKPSTPAYSIERFPLIIEYRCSEVIQTIGRSFILQEHYTKEYHNADNLHTIFTYMRSKLTLITNCDVFPPDSISYRNVKYLNSVVDDQISIINEIYDKEKSNLSYSNVYNFLRNVELKYQKITRGKYSYSLRDLSYESTSIITIHKEGGEKV